MFAFTLHDHLMITVEPGNYICLEDVRSNVSEFYEWDRFLEIAPDGEALACKVLSTLEGVFDTFARTLGQPCPSSNWMS